MRIFWHQGGLHIEPQSDDEPQALVGLLESVGTEPKPEMRTGSGSSELGSDGLLDAVVCDHEITPRRFARKSCDKDTVVAINVRHKPVSNLSRGLGSSK